PAGAPPGTPLDLAATLQRIAARVGQLPLPALLREASDATERHAIDTALAQAGGRMAAAALQLGIDTAELQRRMRRLGLATDDAG
ncbi:MAG: helix-turn-helix domain-containing protein, partial [Aquincola tertiaricarbonis]